MLYMIRGRCPQQLGGKTNAQAAHLARLKKLNEEEARPRRASPESERLEGRQSLQGPNWQNFPTLEAARS